MRDAGYRSAEEVDSWKARDPLKLLAARMAAEDVAAIEAEVKAQVDAAYDFARNSPYPDPSTAMTHVFAE